MDPWIHLYSCCKAWYSQDHVFLSLYKTIPLGLDTLAWFFSALSTCNSFLVHTNECGVWKCSEVCQKKNPFLQTRRIQETFMPFLRKKKWKENYCWQGKFPRQIAWAGKACLEDAALIWLQDSPIISALGFWRYPRRGEIQNALLSWLWCRPFKPEVLRRQHKSGSLSLANF